MAVLSDPISDFLTRLKNASLAGNEEFTAPCSNIKVEIARILQEEGYIWNYEVTGEGTKKQIKVKTKFTPQGKPVVTDVKRSSKPAAASTFLPRTFPAFSVGLHCHRLHLPWCDDRVRRRASRASAANFSPLYGNH